MPRLGGLVFAAGVVAAVVTGCSSTPVPPPSTVAVSPSVPTGLTPAPTDVPELLDDGSTTAPMPGSTLVLDDLSRTSAIETGQKVMTLFARRSVSAEQWIADLSPDLTSQAAQAYQHVNPANVPPTKVTGQVTLTPASAAQVARVSVPTDVGVYLVILTRTDESPTWRADRILPPEGPGDS